MNSKKHPAVFLDRDGTLITERRHLTDVRKIRFYPGVFPALAKLQRAGFLLAITTNQSGVGRGYITLKQLLAINRHFTALLAKRGVRLSGIYFCPHLPTAGCACRKPKTALAKRAVRELNIDLKKSFVVGDQKTDIFMAKALGLPSALVLTGAGRSLRKELLLHATKITSNIRTAADWVVRNKRP